MELYKVDCMNDEWAEKLLVHISKDNVKGVRLGKAVVFEPIGLNGWGYCAHRFHGFTDTPNDGDVIAFKNHWGL